MKVNWTSMGGAKLNSRVQEESAIARSTDDIDTQIRLAKNSESKIVLLSLSLNRNLSEEAVKELFDRDILDITRRLINLGFKD